MFFFFLPMFIHQEGQSLTLYQLLWQTFVVLVVVVLLYNCVPEGCPSFTMQRRSLSALCSALKVIMVCFSSAQKLDVSSSRCGDRGGGAR